MAYLRRIAALLLRAKDLDDRQGQSRPFTLREPCNACIYTAKKARKHDTAFSRHPEMRPRARLTKDLAVRRAEQNQITSFLLRSKLSH